MGTLAFRTKVQEIHTLIIWEFQPHDINVGFSFEYMFSAQESLMYDECMHVEAKQNIEDKENNIELVSQKQQFKAK